MQNNTIKKVTIVLLFFFFLPIGLVFPNESNPIQHSPEKCIEPLPASLYESSFEFYGDEAYSDHGYSLAESLDGFFVVGDTKTYGNGNYDAWLMKFNNNGVLLWNTTWGTTGEDRATDVAINNENCPFVLGSTGDLGGYTDIVLIKFDSSGEELWNVTWGEEGFHDYPKALTIDADNNIYATGWTESYGNGYQDVFLVKFLPNGDVAWNRTWGGGDQDQGNSIGLDEYNNIYVSGQMQANGTGDYNMWLLKYANNGDLLWNVTWDAPGDDGGGSYGMILDNENNIYISGHTNSYDAQLQDVLVLKYDSNGNLLWNTTWGTSGNDAGTGVYLDDSGYLYVAGRYSTSGLLMALDASTGEIFTTLGFVFDLQQDYTFDVFINTTGTIFLSGDSDRTGSGTGDCVLLKIENLDMDEDSLPDFWEIQNLLNPTLGADNVSDADSDGLTNLAEFLYETNPQLQDTDGDSIFDGEEVILGLDGYITDPIDIDTDDDIMPDGWEVENGLNPNDPNDQNLDSDADGLNNVYEFQNGTNPNLKDTDFDLLWDGEEVLTYHTNPLSNDTDSDLLPDNWEIQYGLDALVPCKTEDADIDGLTNYQEYLLGTDPRKADTDGDSIEDGIEINLGTDPLDPNDPGPDEETWFEKVGLEVSIAIATGLVGLAFWYIKARLSKKENQNSKE